MGDQIFIYYILLTVFRGLEPRGELTYPAWKNTYQENENCDTTGCNYGNGQFGPYFDEEMFVEPPRTSFNSITWHVLIEFNLNPEKK